MGRLVLALVAVAAFCPAAVAAPKVTWIPANKANYSAATRPAHAVRLVVVHSVEGTYWGAIGWFRNPRARVSSHYVVGRDGAVAQMVSLRQVAWHAGNRWVNARSVGIENEGFADVPWTFTDAQYRASAAVAAAVLRRSLLPIDRRHVIGHHEVADPRRPWLRGGYGHHRDPGPYWDWRRYMAYVRLYARGDEPAPLSLDVTTNLPLVEKKVSGVRRWEALPTGPVERVDFLVDGRVRGSVQDWPYELEWDTRRERNGKHVLEVRAVGWDGAVARAGTLAAVTNRPPTNPPPPATPPLKVSALNLVEGQTVSGTVRVEAATSRPPDRVELLIDGQLRASASVPPYAFDWETAGEIPGTHVVTVRAIVRGYAVSARTVAVLVEQPPAMP